jgi:hypothetical protein
MWSVNNRSADFTWKETLPNWRQDGHAIAWMTSLAVVALALVATLP